MSGEVQSILVIARNGECARFNWSTMGPGAVYLEPEASYEATHDPGQTLREAICGAWDRGFRLYSVKESGLPAETIHKHAAVFGPIARVVGLREHGSRAQFEEAYRSYCWHRPRQDLRNEVLQEHSKVLRNFLHVLWLEAGVSLEWEFLRSPHAMSLALRCKGLTVSDPLLTVHLFEYTDDDAGGSLMVNMHHVLDPEGCGGSWQRFEHTQALQQLLASALRTPEFRANVRFCEFASRARTL